MVAGVVGGAVGVELVEDEVVGWVAVVAGALVVVGAVVTEVLEVVAVAAGLVGTGHWRRANAASSAARRLRAELSVASTPDRLFTESVSVPTALAASVQCPALSAEETEFS